MAQRKTLTDKQVLILRWIGDDCPSGVMDGDFHRISAAALRRRGLITTTGSGATWSAQVTPTGRDYLARVDGPNPPIARQGNTSVTEQLIDDVLAAGGALRVPRMRWGDRDAVDCEQRARLAGRYGKVPAGKRLTGTEVDGELEIALVDDPSAVDGRAELLAVAIPDKVGRYHPAAREFRDRANRHEVSRAMVPRAMRIVHAIAVEAERRGWSARPASESRNGYGRTDWTATKDGHLQITADGIEFWLRLQEQGVHARGPWEDEVRRYRHVSRDSFLGRDREVPTGAYDAGATGRLMVELHVGRSWIYKGRQSRFADRQSWTLEERLPHLLREIEERVAEARRVAEQGRVASERAAEAARRAAEERERNWHQLMDRARELLVETHRAAQLRAQADAWDEACRLRRYCDAMDATHGDHPGTARWIAWARARTDQLDPLTEPPTMPDAPEATPEALQPHLPNGWSAHGPEHGPNPHPSAQFRR